MPLVLPSEDDAKYSDSHVEGFLEKQVCGGGLVCAECLLTPRTLRRYAPLWRACMFVCLPTVGRTAIIIHQASDNPKKFQRRWFTVVNEWLAYAHAAHGPLDANKAVNIKDAEVRRDT